MVSGGTCSAVVGDEEEDGVAAPRRSSPSEECASSGSSWELIYLYQHLEQLCWRIEATSLYSVNRSSSRNISSRFLNSSACVSCFLDGFLMFSASFPSSRRRVPA